MHPAIEDFYKNNEARVGEDYTRNPPIHYEPLKTALEHYFKTIHEKRDTYHFSLQFKLLTRENLSFSYSDIENASDCINAFGRYFELLFKYLVKKHSPETNIYKKGLEDSYTIARRVIRATPALKRYRFILVEPELTGIKFLIDWRNRLTHNGSIFPNNHALDYLASQQVLPVVFRLHEIERMDNQGYVPTYFKTKSGANIIKRILTIKFDYRDFKRKRQQRPLAAKLLYLNHLKELGRASMYNRLMLKHNKAWHEVYYENPIGKLERFARSEESHPDYYDTRKCPVCGVKCLVIYRKDIEDIFNTGNTFISWFKCQNCTYSIKNESMDDPFYYGIFRSPVFPEQ